MTGEKKAAMVKAEDNEPRLRDLEAQRQEEGHSGGGGPEGHYGWKMVYPGDMEGATAPKGQAGANGPHSVLLALKSQRRV